MDMRVSKMSTGSLRPKENLNSSTRARAHGHECQWQDRCHRARSVHPLTHAPNVTLTHVRGVSAHTHKRWVLLELTVRQEDYEVVELVRSPSLENLRGVVVGLQLPLAPKCAQEGQHVIAQQRMLLWQEWSRGGVSCAMFLVILLVALL